MSEEIKKQWPGDIAVADVRGNYPGCRAMTFSNSGEMNSFFEKSPGMLVVYVAPVNGGIFCLYTRTVSEEEMAEFAEVQREARRLIDERKAKRVEAEQKAQEAAANAQREVARLAELGRVCEANHAAVIEENRKLKKGKK